MSARSFCVSLRKPLFALLFVRLAVIPPTMHNHAAVTRVQTGTHTHDVMGSPMSGGGEMGRRSVGGRASELRGRGGEKNTS